MLDVAEKIINEIIETEGGFVDHPDDPGGATNCGITEAVARAYGYDGSMRDLPRSLAFEIYTVKYWYSIRGDDLAAVNADIAYEVADTGVNCGVVTSGRILQRCLNVLNRKGALYRDLSVDGIIGPVTVNALRKYCAAREPEILLRALNCLQGARYVELAERNEKHETNIYGWFANRVGGV